MNGNTSHRIEEMEIEVEENDSDTAERQTLTSSVSEQPKVSKRFCCLRINFTRGEDSELHVQVVVQTLRLVAMSLYALMVVLSITLTKIFYGQFPQDNIIKKTFGANNICLYFDFPPTTYIMPPLWSLTCIIVALYCAASIYRYHVAWTEGKLSGILRKTLSIITLGYLCATLVFSLCFAIQPKDHVHLILHTLPFTHFILWQILEQGSWVYFGFKYGWMEMDEEGELYMPGIYKWISFGHWILQAFHGTIHVIYQLNGLMMTGGLLIEVTTPWFATLGEFSGYVYLFLAFICPFLQSAYESFKNKRSHKVLVVIKDNRKSC